MGCLSDLRVSSVQLVEYAFYLEHVLQMLLECLLYDDSLGEVGRREELSLAREGSPDLAAGSYLLVSS
jgi:hypothetical protein